MHHIPSSGFPQPTDILRIIDDIIRTFPYMSRFMNFLAKRRMVALEDRTNFLSTRSFGRTILNGKYTYRITLGSKLYELENVWSIALDIDGEIRNLATTGFSRSKMIVSSEFTKIETRAEPSITYGNNPKKPESLYLRLHSWLLSLDDGKEIKNLVSELQQWRENLGFMYILKFKDRLRRYWLGSPSKPS